MTPPTQEQYVVGVDFGTLSGRALVVRVSDGAELGTAVHDYPHGVSTDRCPARDRSALPPDWALQVPEDYRDVLRTAVPAAVAAAGIDPAHVIGIAHRLHRLHHGARRSPTARRCASCRPAPTGRTPTSSCGSTTPRSRRPTASTRSPPSAARRGCRATAG